MQQGVLAGYAHHAWGGLMNYLSPRCYLVEKQVTDTTIIAFRSDCLNLLEVFEICFDCSMGGLGRFRLVFLVRRKSRAVTTKVLLVLASNIPTDFL